MKESGTSCSKDKVATCITHDILSNLYKKINKVLVWEIPRMGPLIQSINHLDTFSPCCSEFLHWSGIQKLCLFVPQSHFPQRLADESKLADFEGGRPSAAFVKNRQGISVVVMKQVKIHGCRPGNSPDQLRKNLPGIHQASAGHRQIPCRCPCAVFSWMGTRVSTGHLAMACRSLFKTVSR